MTSSESKNSESIPASPPRRRRHRIRRLLLLLGVLVVLTAAAAYAGRRFLHSNMAHQWVISAIEARTGLWLKAGSVRIHWRGRTELRNISAGLPLGRHAIIHARTLLLRHNNVLWYLLTGHLGLSAITLNRPKFIIRRAAQGGWTPALLYQALQQSWTQWKLTHPDARPLSALNFPQLTITGGQLDAPAFGGNWLHMRRIMISVRPRGPITWDFHISTPAAAQAPWINVRGTVVPQQQWMHTMQVQGGRLSRWLRLFWPQWHGPAHLAARLVGAVTAAGLTEHASDIHLLMGALAVQGRADVTYSDQRWQIAPRNLRFLSAWWPQKISVSRGTLWADRQGVHGAGLSARIAGGNLHLDGLFNPARGHVAIKAAWRNISILGADLQSGTLSGSLLTPWPGQRVINAQIASTGQSPGGNWDARINLSGQGSLHHGISWRLVAPRLGIISKTTINLDGLAAQGTADPVRITVSSCNMAKDPFLRISGDYNLPLGVWHLRLRCHGNSIPFTGLPANSELRLRAYGNGGGMQIQNFQLANGVWSLAAGGNCIFVRHYPAHLLLTVTGLPVTSRSGGATAPWEMGGVMSGHLRARGNLLPLQLHLHGRLAGADLKVNQHRLALPPVIVQGDIAGRMITADTQPVALLGGRIRLHGKAALTGRLASMSVSAKGIEAKGLAELLLPHASGAIGGRVNLQMDMKLPNRDVARAGMHGKLTISRLKWPALWPGTQPVDITSADARITYQGGRLTIEPTVVQAAGGGAIRGSAIWQLRHPRHVSLAMNLVDWPVAVPSQSLKFSLTGSTSGSFNVARQSYRGTGKISAGISKMVFPIGSATLRFNALGRIFAVSQLRATVLGNNLKGQGIYNVDNPLASSAQLQCDLVNIPILFPSIRAMHALRGGFHGTLSAGPAHGPHAPAPMEAMLTLKSDHARLGAMAIGTIQLHGFISSHSVVVNHSSLAVARGVLHPWARLARHSGGVYSTQLDLNFSGLDLAQITRTVKPRALPVPGILAGRISIIATPGRWRAAFGRGELQITQSDLINTTIISALYNLLHVSTGMQTPIGHGHAAWRLENGNAEITSLHYTDRGASTLATGTVYNIWNMPDSKINGYVVGTVQPLGNFHIPFVPQTKAVLDALESNVSTIQVGGTWKNPTAIPVAFKQLGQTIHETFIRAIVGRKRAAAGQ